MEVLEECKQIGSSRKKSQCTAYGVVGVLKLFQGECSDSSDNQDTR